MLNKIKKIKKKYIVLFLIFVLVLITPFTFSKYISKYTRYIHISAIKSEYMVVFDANGGEGSMESQSFNSGTSQRLNKSTFTKEDCDFWKWNTKADGTGTSYADEAELNSLISENRKTITLYAIYSRVSYVQTGDIKFDGQGGQNPYIDTGVFLFNKKNKNKDFEVSFEIKERESKDAYATIMSSMSEKGRPWPGMVYRLSSDTTDQLVVNETSSNSFNNTSYISTEVKKVTLKRINGVIYLSINDLEPTQILNVSNVEEFDYPVVFGAGLDGNMQPQRWFKGTLSNLKVVIIDNTIDTIRYHANGGHKANGEAGEEIIQNISTDTGCKLLKSPFVRDGYVFLNWNTQSDGKGTSYEEEEVLTNLNSDNKTLDLYAIYAHDGYSHPGEITFDGEGSNYPYINTEVYLFSSKYINKDFEVSFEIKSYGSNSSSGVDGDNPTLMSAMDERGTPWPGMTYRLGNEWGDEFIFNVKSNINSLKQNKREPQKIIIKRINGSIYLKIDEETEEQLVDTSSLMQPFDFPLVFGAGLDGNKEPRRWFKGTLSNIKVAFYEPDTQKGKIRFNPNEGNGNPLSQLVSPNTTEKLMKNTYVREGFVFKEWNTKADGTGTAYSDEQEVNLIKDSGQLVELYAQWKTYKYTVEYHTNNGINSVISQEFDGGKSIQLNPKLDDFKMEGYNFAFWNTNENGSGVSYEYNETVENLGTEENQVVKLYAMYEKFKYQDSNDRTFDGTDYIDTHIYLFSRKNASKNFKITFTIKEFTNTQHYDTIINSLDESGKPYSGFVFRINDSLIDNPNSSEHFNLEANVSEDKSLSKYNIYPLEPQKIEIERVDGVLTLKRDDGEKETIVDFNNLSKNFYYPVTVGASLDKDFNPWRHFVGTISDLSIELINPDIIE